MTENLEAAIGHEYVADLMPEIIREAVKPAAVVVKMPLFAPNRKEADVRSQIEAAFPGVPVIFVDQGTEIEVIHATE